MGTVAERAASIRLVIFDVDGVLTDGRLFFGPEGEAFKAFHARDGAGIKRLVAAGVEVAILSGRRSPAVECRMQELGVRHVFQGCEDKLAEFSRLAGELGIEPAAVAAVGDDTPDLALIREVGLGIAVADAHPAVREAAAWTTNLPGGRGAGGEVCELILGARGNG